MNVNRRKSSSLLTVNAETAKQRRRRDAWILTLLAISGLWLGGFTFYAALVVPLGTEAVGATEQGFVTQQVTRRLNVLGAAAIAAWIIDGLVSNRRRLLITAAIAGALQSALFAVQPVLDAGLDAGSRIVYDEDAFYRWHRVYLWLAASLWIVGILHSGWLVRSLLNRERSEAAMRSEDSPMSAKSVGADER